MSRIPGKRFSQEIAEVLQHARSWFGCFIGSYDVRFSSIEDLGMVKGS